MANIYKWPVKDSSGKVIERKDYDNWQTMNINHNALGKNYGKRSGMQMFPTSHDIVYPADHAGLNAGELSMIEKNFNASMTILEKVLRAGNEVLLVSKMSLKLARYLVKAFSGFKDLIIARLTVTTLDESLREYFEPNAPPINDRLDALRFLYNAGWNTSVSIEPCLERDPAGLIDVVSSSVSGTIWLGGISFLGQVKARVDDVHARLLDEIYEAGNLRTWMKHGERKNVIIKNSLTDMI